MSRTYKKYPEYIFRFPRGKLRALRAGVERSKAIPPDDYDDLQHDRQAFLPFKVAKGLWENCYSEEEVVRHLRKKFGLRLGKAQSIVDWVFEWRKDIDTNGMMRVGKYERSDSGDGMCEERDIISGGDTE